MTPLIVSVEPFRTPIRRWPAELTKARLPAHVLLPLLLNNAPVELFPEPESINVAPVTVMPPDSSKLLLLVSLVAMDPPAASAVELLNSRVPLSIVVNPVYAPLPASVTRFNPDFTMESAPPPTPSRSVPANVKSEVPFNMSVDALNEAFSTIAPLGVAAVLSTGTTKLLPFRRSNVPSDTPEPNAIPTGLERLSAPE